jgi:dTDP-4-dehydrorhamnose 3,5-epimerase
VARFEFLATPLADSLLVQRRRIDDERGFLSRLYCREEFRTAGVEATLSQINHTLTRHRATLRGMHFQRRPYAETKLVSCIRGEVFDVAVDLRRGSPTFLAWHGEVLSAANQRSLLIPEGFAHGFQTLADDCELMYFHTAAYEPMAEGALNAMDPRLAIAWPLPVGQWSPRDRQVAMLGDTLEGIDP